MLFCYLGAAVIRFLFGKEKDKLPVGIFALMAAVYLGTTFMTPFGAQIWKFLYSTHAMYVTEEMQPLNWSSENYLLVYSIVVLLSAIYLWKSASPVRSLLALSFFLDGWRFARLIMYFSLASCQIVGEALSAMLSRFTELKPLAQVSDAVRHAAFSWIYPFMIVSISVLAVCAQPHFIRRTVPINAVEYLANPPAIAALGERRYGLIGKAKSKKKMIYGGDTLLKGSDEQAVR